jgi:hypothetical protein
MARDGNKNDPAKRDRKEAVMGRYIGIRHRIKKTKDGEAKPTQLAIVENGKVVTLDLAEDVDELDWVKGIYPIRWRDVVPDED